MRWWLPLVLLVSACAASPAIESTPVVEASAPAPATSVAPAIEPGVSLELAKWRAEHISDVEYDLTFLIPAEQQAPIEAHAVIRFELSALSCEGMTACGVSVAVARHTNRAERAFLAAVVPDGAVLAGIAVVAVRALTYLHAGHLIGLSHVSTLRYLFC